MRQRWPLGSLPTFLLTLIILGIGIAGLIIYGVNAPDVDIVKLQFAASARAAKALKDPIPDFKDAINTDWWLIIGYGIFTAAACYLGSRIFFTNLSRSLARAAGTAGLVAAVCDCIENIAIWSGLTSLQAGEFVDWKFKLAAAFAAIKLALLLIALPVAIGAVAILLKRSAANWKRNMSAIDQLLGKIWMPWPVLDEHGVKWPEGSSAVARPPVSGLHTRGGAHQPLPPSAHYRYSRMLPSDREPAKAGFCVSGGGIRSGCVTLGALQSLRAELLKARYLVSVSGGGYIAGAIQLALGDGRAAGAEEPQSTAVAKDVYAPGTVEEDHTRRHGNYVADSAGQWLVALWTVLRGLLASLVLMFSTAVVIGLALSYFYSGTRFVNTSQFISYFTLSARRSPPYPVPLGYVGWTVVWVALTAACLWLASIGFVDGRSLRRFRRGLQNIANAAASLVGLLTVIVFVIPAVLWACAYITWIAGDGNTAAPEAVGGAAGTLIVTYLGAIAAIVWRRRETIGTAIKKVGGLGGRKSKEDSVSRLVPNGFTQYVIVWAALAVLLLIGLMILGVTIITGHEWHLAAQITIPSALFLIYIRVDQTWLSLHAFYRRRLATAFSVRRVRLSAGDTAARPYDFDSEITSLSRYGQRRDDFPQLILACAANLSGSDRTPPGRRAVSFTMSHDYIGGPDVGYVPTDLLEAAVSGPLRADLTVQAAVAISGAAFASAMGRQAKAFQTLLAISNARLGTWLPNPAYLFRLAARNRPWWLPRLPRIRRLPYLLREIFGMFQHDDRLLLVTDGGHFDNLGLVELLRHRCRTIYCIDASGDSPPFPQTLNEAITLAREELGIKITLEDTLSLVPGSAQALEPSEPLKGLSARLSKSAVVVGEIEYPEKFRAEGDRCSNKGTLIFAKALLTPDMPGELLAYAQAQSIFPRDGTGDQWFSHDQFDAYQGLGRYIGKKAAEAAKGHGPTLKDQILTLIGNPNC